MFWSIAIAFPVSDVPELVDGVVVEAEEVVALDAAVSLAVLVV